MPRPTTEHLAPRWDRGRGLPWDVARQWGTIRTITRKGRAPQLVVDFGRSGKLWSDRGAPFDQQRAEHVLASVRLLAGEIGKRAAVDRFAATGSIQRRVSTWLPRWLDEFESLVEAGERSPRTLRDYRRWSKPDNHFEFWRKRSIDRIGYSDGVEWLTWLKKRIGSDKARKNVVTGFLAFLSWLVKVEAIDRVPSLPSPKVQERDPRTITRDQQRQILDAIPEEARGVYLAMALLGIRPSEAIAMRPSQVRANGTVIIDRARADRQLYTDAPRTKTRRARTLPLPPELLAWIDKHVSPEQRAGCGPLFRLHTTGGPWSERSLRWWWHKARVQAGVPPIGVYAGTKHSLATELRRDGVPLDVIQAILGHADSRSTERYARLSDQAVVRALRRPRAGRE